MCGFEGDLTLFVKDNRAANGHRNKCKTCERERLRKFQIENRGKVNAANRASYEKHREKRLKSNKLYDEANKQKRSEDARKRYSVNREYILKQCKEYRENNPDVARAGWMRRRTREKSLPTELKTSELTEIISKFGNKCAISGNPAEHLDHFIPVSTGHGGTVYGNLIPLTAFLNLSKNGRNPFIWAETLNQIEKENFNLVIIYLSEINGLTVEEYREFVFWCFKNKRNFENIQDSNKDSISLWISSKTKN